ncbi:hypothetical protein TURU_008828 [Turdus rufiventris]|nr:hypothetical protein TURU_008828 [Turdus rufiventris]
MVDDVKKQNGLPVTQKEAVRELLRCLDIHNSMDPDVAHPRVTHLVDAGKAVDIVYLDFNEAFDTVSNSTLLEKLAACGLGWRTLCWVKNWLDGWAQRMVNGAASSWGSVTVEFNIFIDE